MKKKKSAASIIADNYLSRKFEERLSSLSDEELAEQCISMEEAIACGYDPKAEAEKPEWVKKEEDAEAELCCRALDLVNERQMNNDC